MTKRSIPVLCAIMLAATAGCDDLNTPEFDPSKPRNDRVVVSDGSPIITPRLLKIMEGTPLIHGPSHECRPPRADDPWSIHPSEVIRCRPEQLPLSETKAHAVVRGYIEAMDEVKGYEDREYPDPWEEFLRAQWVPLLTETTRDGTAKETEAVRNDVLR